MKFVCDRCQTKYSIADEKVRGKILKVRCKSCSNVITVREGPAAAPAHPQATEFEESARTVVSSAPDHIAAVARATHRPSASMRAVASPPAPPGPGDDVQWFLALEGVQKGPFSRRGLVDKLVALPRDADVHVWNEKLDGWKPPKDVAVIERELQARRRSATTAAPAPPPGMRPRTTTGPQVAPASAARSTKSHPLPGPHGSAGSHAPGHGPAAAASAHEQGAPAGPHRTRHPTNGVAAHVGGAPVAPLTGESDALNALNLKQGAAPHGDPSHAHDPRRAQVPALDVGGGDSALGDVAGVGVPWQAPSVPSISTSSPSVTTSMLAVSRHRNTKFIFAILGIVGVIVVVVTFNLMKKPPAVTVDKPRATAPEETIAVLAEKMEQERLQRAAGNEPSVVAPAAPAVPAKTESKATVATVKAKPPKRGARGGRVAPGRGGRGTTVAASGGTEADPTAARFNDGGGRTLNLPTGGGGARGTPAQSDISRVISNNKAGIKICYQRALLRDSSLTHGKISVRVSIGISGRAKSVNVDGPPAFRALEPCIKEVLSRWAFPPSSEEYGTEFSYIFQGNE